jgi:hypothetical protein
MVLLFSYCPNSWLLVPFVGLKVEGQGQGQGQGHGKQGPPLPPPRKGRRGTWPDDVPYPELLQQVRAFELRNRAGLRASHSPPASALGMAHRRALESLRSRAPPLALAQLHMPTTFASAEHPDVPHARVICNANAARSRDVGAGGCGCQGCWRWRTTTLLLQGSQPS